MKKEVIQYFTIVSNNYQRKQNFGVWSLLRDYELKQIKKKILPHISCNKIALELGAGIGGLTKLLLEINNLSVVAVDIVGEMLTQIPVHERLEKRLVDIEIITDISEFDVIISFGAFEFLEDPNKVLKEYILKKNNDCRVIVIAPFKNWRGKLYRFFHPGKKIDLRFISLTELKKLNVSIEYTPIYPFNNMLIIK